METSETIDISEEVEEPQSIPTGPKTISREEIRRKAAELKEINQLPEIPAKNPTFETLDGWFKLLTVDNWKILSPYLYRSYPIIQRKLANPEANAYIDVITPDAISEGLLQYIKKNHGGGKYKFIVNDLTKPSNKRTIMESYLTISTDECMPILNYRELDMNEKKNMGYLNILRSNNIIDGNGMPITTAAATAPGTDPSSLAREMGGMFEKFMGMYVQLNKDQQTTINKFLADGTNKKEDTGITTLLLERLKQDDPSKQTDSIIKMFTLMQGMLPKSDSGNAMFERILQMQADNNKSQLEMMKMMMENNNKKSNDDGEGGFFSSLLKFAKVKEAMPELFGGNGNSGGGGKPTLAETIIDGVKEIGLPILGVVSQLIQVNTGKKPIVPVTQGQAREMVENVIQMPDPNSKPTQLTEGQSNMQHPAPGQPTPQSLDTGNPNDLSIMQEIILKYGGILVNPIKSGMSGVELGERMSEMAPMIGTDIYSIIKSQGKAKIIRGMRSVPEFWANTGGLLGEEKISKLIDDFLDWENLIQDDDEEEGTDNAG